MRLALVLTLLLAAPALAAPGDRDRSFGVRVDGLEAAEALRVEPDGHVLVAGGTMRPGVVRVTARGRRDRVFGRHGVFARRDLGPARVLGVGRDAQRRVRVALTALDLGVPAVRALTVSPGGRAYGLRAFAGFFAGPIVAGVQRPDHGAFVVTRDGVLRAFGPDGTLDRGFGERALCPPGTVYGCFAGELAATPDGGVVIGTSRDASRRVVRLSPRGVIRWSVRVPGFVEALHVMRTGRVVAALRTRRGQIVRISADGRVVRRSSLRAPRRGTAETIDAVTTDARGRIYVLQQVRVAGRDLARQRSRVLRLSPAGEQHRGFEARVPPPRDEYSANLGRTLALDRRGGLLVGGGFFNQGEQDHTLGCDFREDVCATGVRLRVWRFRR